MLRSFTVTLPECCIFAGREGSGRQPAETWLVSPVSPMRSAEGIVSAAGALEFPFTASMVTRVAPKSKSAERHSAEFSIFVVLDLTLPPPPHGLHADWRHVFPRVFRGSELVVTSSVQARPASCEEPCAPAPYPQAARQQYPTCDTQTVWKATPELHCVVTKASLHRAARRLRVRGRLEHGNAYTVHRGPRPASAYYRNLVHHISANSVLSQQTLWCDAI